VAQFICYKVLIKSCKESFSVGRAGEAVLVLKSFGKKIVLPFVFKDL